MYTKKCSNVFYIMMLTYDVNWMYIKVVELKIAYLWIEDHFKINCISLEKNLK